MYLFAKFKNPDISCEPCHLPSDNFATLWHRLVRVGSLLPAHLSHNQGRFSGAYSKALRNKPSHHTLLTPDPTFLSLPTPL